jgi:cobalt-zinc-cadmium efflux system outer membrane protein
VSSTSAVEIRSVLPARFRLLAAARLALCVAAPRWAVAQDAPAVVTREAAVEAALASGPRLGLARADTSLALAQLLSARARQNPVLATSYSKSTPQYHATLELPLGYPWLRRSRVGSAEAARLAAQYRFEFNRAAVAVEADTSYTRAVAAHAHARLSRRNADAADSLLRMAVVRRDAGDASDLDVELATLSAGQQVNAAASDSLAFLSAVLDLQALMGLPPDRVTITVADSLPRPPAMDRSRSSGAPLQIAAAEASLRSAELAARLQHRSALPTPSLTAGIEAGDPSGAEPGILPTVGLSIPLPFLNRNQAPLAQAEAERGRARAELAVARTEGASRLAHAIREQEVALAKVSRDQSLLEAAARVAAKSLTAYHEGATSLPSVLEAQRNVRDIRAQFVDDLARAWIAGATVHLFGLTSEASPAP